jgi:hypothetical protein
VPKYQHLPISPPKHVSTARPTTDVGCGQSIPRIFSERIRSKNLPAVPIKQRSKDRWISRHKRKLQPSQLLEQLPAIGWCEQKERPSYLGTIVLPSVWCFPRHKSPCTRTAASYSVANLEAKFSAQDTYRPATRVVKVKGRTETTRNELLETAMLFCVCSLNNLKAAVLSASICQTSSCPGRTTNPFVFIS